MPRNQRHLRAAMSLAVLLCACGGSTATVASHDTAASSSSSAATTPGATPTATPAKPGGKAPSTHAQSSGGSSAASSSAEAAASRAGQFKPQSPNGHASVQTSLGTNFAVAGSTCQVSGDQAVLFFGTTGSGEEVDIYIASHYSGPGTYAAPTADASITVLHSGQTWNGQFKSDPNATLTIDSGGRTGHFTYVSQTGTAQTVSGSFACG